MYTGEVQTARADNRLGLPLGAAYLREASRLMRGTLLPAAHSVSAQADARLAAASGQATGLPLALVLLVAAVIAGYVLYRAQRWLLRRTHRRLNPGLVVASVAGVISVLWLAIALTVARADLLQARDHGSTPVAALARADIAALQARADESLTLIDAGGDDNFQADYVAIQHRLGPGPGTLLTNAASAAHGSPGGGSALAATTAATAWYRAHKTVRALDDNGQHTKAVGLVTIAGPGSFQHPVRAPRRLADQRYRRGSGRISAHAMAGRNAFTGLEIGVIVLALIMAAGCARGLSTRLAEYR